MRARRYQELELGPHASGWVIHWEVGHNTGWHDHGGATATIIVASGVLYQELRRSDDLAHDIYVTGPGHSITIDSVLQHKVVPQVPCVAIHIYTPRLEVMNVFDEDGSFLHTQNAAEELHEFDAEEYEGEQVWSAWHDFPDGDQPISV